LGLCVGGGCCGGGGEGEGGGGGGKYLTLNAVMNGVDVHIKTIHAPFMTAFN